MLMEHEQEQEKTTKSKRLSSKIIIKRVWFQTAIAGNPTSLMRKGG